MTEKIVQNSISVKNSSDEMIVIIVEYIAFIEDLQPGETFTIKVSTKIDNPITNLFSIDYQVKQVTVYVYNETMDSYDLECYINEKCILEQRL
jgi:hypothetical protein